MFVCICVYVGVFDDDVMGVGYWQQGLSGLVSTVYGDVICLHAEE